VTRGTRPKKPSSSRGFAREARLPGELGELGDLGDCKPKTEIFFLSFQESNNYPKNKNKNKNI
jgi:hypothetical protein